MGTVYPVIQGIGAVVLAKVNLKIQNATSSV